MIFSGLIVRIFTVCKAHIFSLLFCYFNSLENERTYKFVQKYELQIVTRNFPHKKSGKKITSAGQLDAPGLMVSPGEGGTT